jgi:gliding motility-associated-like protein
MRKTARQAFAVKALTTCIALLLAGKGLFAQTFITIGSGTTTNTTSGYPCPVADYWEGHRAQYLYRASELNAAGMATGFINAIRFTATAAPGDVVEQYQIRIGHTTANSLSSTAWDAFSGPTVATAPVNYTVVVGNNTFTLPTPFLWNGTDNIMVEICSGDPNNASASTWSSNASFPFSTVGFNGSHTYAVDNGGNLCGTVNSTNTPTSATQTNRPNITFNWVPGAACSGTPTGGAAVANPTTACVGETFSLSLSGATVATGLTYQWQRSADNSTWTNIAGATLPSLSTSQTASTWYRCVITCTTSSQTVQSTSVRVLSPTLVSGTFTINNNQPTGGTNFNSFNDAYNYIKCGINGPVVFNVDPASGPYVEQLYMTRVNGATAANTVTFNGNGRTLRFVSTNPSRRAVVTLDGADHIIFDSLVIHANGTNPTTEYGWGMFLTNDADSNIVRRSTIRSSDSLTSTNYSAIAIGSSATSATTQGNAGCDFNRFTGNDIVGGYYAVTDVGNPTTLANQRNQFVGNTVRDFYFYGFYSAGTSTQVIERNDIFRTGRKGTSSTAYGIYFTGLSTRARINANRIRNMFDFNPTSTSIFYGIYFLSCDALAGLENKVTNNAIYAIRSAGTIYGITNSGSDNVDFDHNTVAIDDATATVGTSVQVRGIYVLGTFTAGTVLTRFRNNMVSVNRGGTGTNHAIYLSSAALSTSIQSNNNNLQVAGPNAHVGYNGVNRTTLADWRTAATQDAQSASLPPQYASPGTGNFRPLNAGLNDLGASVGVTSDILGLARSSSTPDIGAWEFDVPPCTAPPTAGTATSSITGSICPNENVQLGLVGNSFGTGQTYQWQSAPSATGPWTDIGGVLNSPGFSVKPGATTFHRCAVTCSGNTAFSTTIQLTVSAFFPGGTYTINKALPTGGTNFKSFNDAYFAMRCGISGPIVFNVVAGSGPYTEQLIMNAIQGTSATNTVTWNGNGNTIQFLSTSSDERATIKLNGASFQVFDSLRIVAQGSTTTEYGFGVHLRNNADNNIFRKCRVEVDKTQASSNYAGVVLGVGPSPTASGDPGTDNNLFERNTIIGGYVSIPVYGKSGTPVDNNRFVRNIVQDYYIDGLDIYYANNLLIEGNEFSRPTRTGVTSFYAVYAFGINLGMKVVGNRFHTPYGGVPTSTSTSYPIYLSGSDAEATNPTLIANNAIYNFNGTGGVFGIYLSSSDNANVYHNTVDLSGTQASTSATYAFYLASASTGVNLRNNLFTVRRAGTGLKYGIYLASGTDAASNNNAVFVEGSNSHVGFNGTNRTTLAAWQSATGKDANSVSANPLYTNPAVGDLTPRSPALDNRGSALATVVPNDITGAVRSATAPDPGAWEFAIPPCVAPPPAGTATATPNTNFCIQTPIALNLTGVTAGSGQTYQWQFASSATGPWSNVGNPLLFADTTVEASASGFYRCIVTCSGQSATSSAVQVTMNPPFPGGTFTIDNTQPTTWPTGTNFNSFNAAVAVLRCGISAPVTFNVVAGTYTEQVMIKRITGASNVNRITFQSANGDPASVILRATGTSTANYVLMLDSASHITFKGMTVNTQSTTFARAIVIENTASFDSVLNCRVNVAPATAISTELAAIYSASLSGRNIVIRGNTLTGGSSTVNMTGSTIQYPQFVSIDSNTVNGGWEDNIAVFNMNFSSVSKNTVNLAMPRNTTAWGIYASNLDSAYRINDNIVNIGAMTVTTYGIQPVGCDGANYNGSVSGNRIVSTALSTGTLYGLYQSSSTNNYTVNNIVNIRTSGATSFAFYSAAGTGGLRIYNNSVRSASTATGTNNVAGYFAHTSSTTGQVDIRNNIFLHDAGGIAAFHSSTGPVYSDFNLYFTTGTTLLRRSTVNYATLQAWRDAEFWDYNSLVIRPAVSGNLLQPVLTDSMVWAMHGRGEQRPGNDRDINGQPRPVTLTAGVPDLGAYEFFPGVPPPPLAGVPAAPAAGSTQVFYFGTDTVQKVTWVPGSTVPSSISVRRYSGVIPPALATGQKSMYYYNDVSTSGSSPSNFIMQQFYYEPWLRDVGDERAVKLARTVPAGNWLVSANSLVDDFSNTMTEGSLNHIARFTGSTDGVIPASASNVAPSFTTDTSNRGTRFWVAYGHHQGFSSNSQVMLLYLSATDSANVTVRVNGTNWSRTYAIPANSVRVSDAIPKAGFVDARILDEGLYNRGISITSDKPIVAYAHIYDGANSGAGMLLPVGAYGYEYSSLNFKQYYASDCFSWTMVIADRDSTLVEITPSVTTKGGRPAGVPFQVYLNRGQVYNVMGTTNGSAGTDMTGTVIRSVPNAAGRCFPIAVFSGSSRTAICYISNGDNFIQQVFPRTAWGQKYLTFATANSASNTIYNSNIYRVMVKDPATQVRLNGSLLSPATLRTPGNFYEFSTPQGTGIGSAVYVEANQPVLMSQYMVSTSANECPGVTASDNGDPEMMYISPVEQGVKSVQFYNTNNSAITGNYVNIVLPTAGLASLRIDGASTFTHTFPHPGLPGYSCVRHNLGGSSGQHTVTCDSSFTAVTYGLGSVESYGYNAGTLVRNLKATMSFNNVFNAGATSSYTCKGAPFRLRLVLSTRPTKIVWNMSRVTGVTPNVDVTQDNPVPVDSTVVNGQKLYTYVLNQDYIFSQTGFVNVPVTVFDPSIEGCGGSLELSIQIEVRPAPVTNFTATSTGCVGDPVQFAGTATPYGSAAITTWTYTFGDGSNSTLRNPVKTFATAGTYNVNLRAVMNDGCVGDTTKPVTVNPRPVVDIRQDTVFVCNATAATFNVNNPVAGTTYNWYSAATGGTLLGTGNTLVVNNVTATVNVFLEGVALGCASTARDRATAAIRPNLANPVAVVDSVTTNTVYFRWAAVPNATGYEVSTNGGTTWTAPSSGSTGTTHVVGGQQLGATVTLQVRALGGCLPAVSAPVSGQTRTDEVYFPNAFSPNGDGKNDVWRAYSNVVRTIRVMVFNQWGEKIFESADLNTGWNGTQGGKAQPSGVYMFVAEIVKNNGERITRKGSINLVR